MAAPMEDVLFLSVSQKSCKIIGLKVKSKCMLTKGTLIATYKSVGEGGSEEGQITERFKGNVFGTVEEILVQPGDILAPGAPILKYSACRHPTVMKDMCAECGADLRETAGFPGQRKKLTTASVAMVHSIPELQVSKEEALSLANQDEERLLRNRKLVLVVDLDQTVIHTTMENVKANLPGVKHFQLWSGSRQQTPWYHTKVRPGCKKFLEVISKYYELHIFTMGARLYAHTIAGFLDPDKRFFSHRILSRDECFDQNSKTANLESIFPCGDSMVCIIDDRDDVWNFAPNLVLVRPYRYFEGTGDINAPSGLPPGLGAPKEDKVSSVSERTVQESKDAKEESEEEEEEENATKKLDESSKVETPEETSDVSSKEEKDSKTVVETSTAETSKETSDVSKDDNEMETESLEVKASKEQSDDVSKDEKEEKMVIESATDQASEETPDVSKETDEEPKDTSGAKDELEEGELEKTPPGVETPPSVEDDKETSTKKHQEGGKKDGNDKPSKDPEEDCSDDYFLHLEDILIRIHSTFFKTYDNASKSPSLPKADLKAIIPQVRGSVLKGTHIVFSGVFPTNMPPEQSKAWKAAVALGAKVSPKIVPREKGSGGPSNATTHVIAAKVGTNKVHLAQRCKKIHIVTADWLWCCWERWERTDERLFILPGIKTKSKATGSGSSTPANSDSDASTRALNKKRKGTPEGKSKQKRPRFQGDSGIDEATSSSGSGSKQRPSLSSEYNPLYSFSSEDLQSMDKEVEDIFGDSSSSEESDTEDGRSNQESLGSVTQMISSSSEESLTGENPKGWSPNRHKLDSDSDHEVKCHDDSGDSTSSPGVSSDDRSSGDEDLMAEAIDDLLTYSKVPTVAERINLQKQ
ncbi:RNA polymerase II subunit A C-terminal domain phosphatase-like [Amphiura filiformis]|uniref:RNA polymerase II subunit A C-terminal domain phosphatase-like n=1 Tax=Amphiura filiformis TaxID=82378 RepID=UPI003B22397F